VSATTEWFHVVLSRVYKIHTKQILLYTPRKWRSTSTGDRVESDIRLVEGGESAATEWFHVVLSRVCKKNAKRIHVCSQPKKKTDRN